MREPHLRIPSLIGEPVPALRSVDLLTGDHPRRPYPDPHRFRNSIWLRGAVFIAVLAVAIVLCVSAAAAIVGLPIPTDSLVIPWTELIAAAGSYVVLTFVMESRVWPYEIAPRRWLGLLKGALLGLILVSLCIGVLALTGVYRIDSVNPGYNPWRDLLVIGLVAAVAEEILMRGVLFRLVEEGLGTWGAVGVSAIVFGASHLGNPDATLWGAIAIAIEAGILFAALYALTRSLWWCIGLHFAWNIAEGPLFGSVVSGTGAGNSWFGSSWSGPSILTGGQFGLEASIVPVVLLGILGVGLLVYLQRHKMIVAPIWTRRARLSATGQQA